MKKKKPSKVVQLTVHQGGKDAHWDRSVEGVLRKALSEHEKRGYSDLVIVGLRVDEHGVARPETYTFGRDRLRTLGLLKWAGDLMAGRFKG